jgi:hypothetical protein
MAVSLLRSWRRQSLLTEGESVSDASNPEQPMRCAIVAVLKTGRETVPGRRRWVDVATGSGHLPGVRIDDQRRGVHDFKIVTGELRECVQIAGVPTRIRARGAEDPSKRSTLAAAAHTRRDAFVTDATPTQRELARVDLT